MKKKKKNIACAMTVAETERAAIIGAVAVFTGVSEARNRYLCCTKFAVSLYGKVSETYLCVL